MKGKFILKGSNPYGNVDQMFRKNIQNFTDGFSNKTINRLRGPSLFTIPREKVYPDNLLDNYMIHAEGWTPKTKSQVEKVLISYGLQLSHLKINDDLTVDTIDDYKISLFKYQGKKLLIRFGNVFSFDVSDSKLETLVGCPTRVQMSFSCHSNRSLKNLIGAPEAIWSSYFDIRYCQLDSLEGFPKYIGSDVFATGAFRPDERIVLGEGELWYKSDIPKDTVIKGRFYNSGGGGYGHTYKPYRALDAKKSAREAKKEMVQRKWADED